MLFWTLYISFLLSSKCFGQSLNAVHSSSLVFYGDASISGCFSSLVWLSVTLGGEAEQTSISLHLEGDQRTWPGPMFCWDTQLDKTLVRLPACKAVKNGLSWVFHSLGDLGKVHVSLCKYLNLHEVQYGPKNLWFNAADKLFWNEL